MFLFVIDNGLALVDPLVELKPLTSFGISISKSPGSVPMEPDLSPMAPLCLFVGQEKAIILYQLQILLFKEIKLITWQNTAIY